MINVPLIKKGILQGQKEPEGTKIRIRLSFDTIVKIRRIGLTVITPSHPGRESHREKIIFPFVQSLERSIEEDKVTRFNPEYGHGLGL